MKLVRQQGAVSPEVLIATHQGSVRGFLRFLGCPASQLDDLVQDTFLMVLDSPFEQRSSAATAAYLRMVARNLLLKSLAKQYRQQEVMDAEAAEEAWSGFDRGDAGRGYLSALRECLREARPRMRDAIELRYRDGLERTAIAIRLGLSESGVKSILVRGVASLRSCVERRLGA